MPKKIGSPERGENEVRSAALGVVVRNKSLIMALIYHAVPAWHKARGRRISNGLRLCRRPPVHRSMVFVTRRSLRFSKWHVLFGELWGTLRILLGMLRRRLGTLTFGCSGEGGNGYKECVFCWRCEKDLGDTLAVLRDIWGVVGGSWGDLGSPWGHF